jgi:hypothetical protein
MVDMVDANCRSGRNEAFRHPFNVDRRRETVGDVLEAHVAGTIRSPIHLWTHTRPRNDDGLGS